MLASNDFLSLSAMVEMAENKWEWECRILKKMSLTLKKKKL